MGSKSSDGVLGKLAQRPLCVGPVILEVTTPLILADRLCLASANGRQSGFEPLLVLLSPVSDVQAAFLPYQRFGPP